MKYWAPVFLWMLLIFLASTDALSAQHTSRILVPFLHWLRPDISEAAITRIHFLVRKCAHLTEYAIFALLLVRALFNHTRGWQGRFWPSAGVAFLVAAVYASADEFHQSFVPTRGTSARDVMIDSCGALIGLALRWSLTRKQISSRN